MTEYLDYFLEHGVKSAIFWFIGLLTIGLALLIYPINPGGQFPSIDRDKWQAVFLENDQVYFGKLKEYDEGYVVMRDVYYLRSASALDPVTEEQTANLDLIKLGGEVHGPEDEIFIPKAQIVYFENMKKNSRVVESIMESKQ